MNSEVMLGQMKIKYRSETSYNGYSLDVLKSGLQKYIRRSDSDRAIYSAIELFLFQCLEVDKKTSKLQKSIYTNFIHRLMVILLEDIGVAGLNLWFDLNSLFQNLLNRKGDKKQQIKSLINITYSLAESKHSRSPSHFNSVVNAIINNKGEEYRKYFQHFPTVEKMFEIVSQKKSDETIQNYISCLKKNEIDSIYWARLIDLSDLPRNKKRDLIFDNLLDTKKFDKEEILIMKEWYYELYNIKERFLTFYVPLIYIITGKKNESKIWDVGENWKKYPIVNLFTPPLEMDEFVLDLHTKIGKRKGKGVVDFVREGSQVKNEFEVCKEFSNFYNFSKLLSEGIEDISYLVFQNKSSEEMKEDFESDRFDFIVRAQLVTTNTRQDTYFAKDKKTEKIVFVKGPFLDEKQVDFAISIQKLRKDLGLPFVEMEKVFLIPNLIQSALSTRNSVVKDKKYAFIITENLCKEPFQTKSKSSKMWPETEVVDWEKMKKCQVFNPLLADDKLLEEYIKHLLFRKMTKLGDLADRNFVLVEGKTLYSIDEDSIPSYGKEIQIYRDLKKQRANRVREYINKNKKLFEDLLSDWKEKVEEGNKNNIEKIDLDDLDK